ncbi:MAG: hypothetical protein M1348_03280 [Candidatus Parvarchaeota archaeon]|jgi:hypothetical protein|nr:hypothetical protein [Candidatus Parvarchaeota archaeon]MCL5101606.1 hypothetical protein [Candidatus Parvarchaeota archaeon]
MGNRKGITSFTSFIVAIVIIIPVLFVVLVIFVFAIPAIRSNIINVQSYVSETMVALSTGESVITGTLSPSLTDHEFLAQFYGSPACIGLLNELSRTSILSSPNDPSSLNDRYFVCVGDYKDFSASNNPNPPAVWGNYLPQSPGQPALPDWISGSSLSGGWSGLAGINGSQGTLSYAVDANNVSALLASACVAFFNATSSEGWGSPSAYVNSLNCAPLNENNGQLIYMSVNDQTCASTSQGCDYNPWLFLHGSPGSIALQTCSYVSGSSDLVCRFNIN